MSNSLPSSWAAVYLSEVVPTVQYGVSVSLNDDYGIPVLRMNNLHGGSIDISDLKFSSSPDAARLRLQRNDVLFNRTNSIEHVGRTSLWKEELEHASFASYLVRLNPDRERLEPEYLVRWLNLPQTQIEIRRFATPGVHQVNINPTNLRRVEIRLPKDRHEQRLISEILSTVDEAIEQTDALIAKTQQIKAGLMHDLFTRGVTPDGKLRPPREEAPLLFKESPLGWVPKEWEVVELGEIVPRAIYGISVPLDGGHGIPVLRMNNLCDGEAELSDLKFSQSPLARALTLCPGDVLFNRTNSIEHVGRTGIWRGQLPEASFASYLVRLDPNPARLRAEFLNSWLNWETTQIRIRRFATPGVHQVNINPTNLRRTIVALPTILAEQDHIVEALESTAACLRGYCVDLGKLRQLKAGLMNDLLTGLVPVKIPNAAEAPAHA